MKTRIEHDSLGEVQVPTNKSWGAQTQRSLNNFQIGDQTMPLVLIDALVIIKMCAAKVNAHLGQIDKKAAKTIAVVCEDILKGKYYDQFPLSIWQTGSGTQTNMNVNEVIAHLGNKLLKQNKLHANDHVNKSQSSNDVFPSAIHLAGCIIISKRLLPKIKLLIDTLSKLQAQFGHIIKVGRTHLQDATPISLEQEISGWKAMIISSYESLEYALISLRELPLGGTAVGTGINAPKNFDQLINKEISTYTKFKFIPIKNKFRGLASRDQVVLVHGILKTLATSLYKIANDVRWLSSGPTCGIGELIIPANEPGSSIMPGKVNPTQCESIMMVCAQVFGNDTTISFSASQGNFELNTFMPVIAYNFLQSINLLADSIDSFNKHCLVGLKPNLDKIKWGLEHSLMNVTALTPKIGYERAAKVAQYAYQNKMTLKQAATKLNYVTSAEFDQLVDFKKMI